MKLKQLIGAEAAGEKGEHTVAALTADSRSVRPGTVFVALKGVAADGHDYIPDALENGALAIVAGRQVEAGGVPLLVAPETRGWLADAAARFYKDQPGTVVAITGTNGKSSSVDFLRQIWAGAGLKAASLGTLGAIGPAGVVDLGHTTPDPVAVHETLATLARQGVSHMAMEASSHGLEQRRLDGVKLAGVAFTNFTQDHLDYHPTMEAYLAAKLRLFTDLAPAGVPAVVNADSPHCEAFERAAVGAGLAVFSVGWRGRDLKIAELMPRATGQALTLKWQGAEHKLVLPLIGEFQALNALTAAGLALSLGMDFKAVLAGLSKLQPVKGRLEFVGQTSDGAAVFVDYAHTPDGLDVLLRAARPHTAGRLIVVFGCGGDRDALKRPLMGEIAAKQADIAIVTDDNPRTEDAARIRAAILKGAGAAQEIGDRAEAIRAGTAMLKAGDTLVIAGKGHETGQIIGDTVIPFSDQETAQAALKEAANV
ncbi:MAG: UDP-N-acetylmuramoyl-L-alanyl-D-glutamate--2,6-diaminopimelate ligase [Hyphomonadaceae bacterium]|nr:UDP-N-acetylmuramoyl-L-alanyl-D-glutamate--2,6-diaminopimelate ligase [Hyphomonadaceae bacterium]